MEIIMDLFHKIDFSEDSNYLELCFKHSKPVSYHVHFIHHYLFLGMYWGFLCTWSDFVNILMNAQNCVFSVSESSICSTLSLLIASSRVSISWLFFPASFQEDYVKTINITVDSSVSPHNSCAMNYYIFLLYY